MHWLLKFAIIVAGNALALWIAFMVVPGFVLTDNWIKLILVALVLALLNGLLKPLLTLVLGPIIVLTLGIGILVVNALILWILPILLNYIDFLRGSINIQDIPALIYATLIISAVNFVIHLIA
jgi:putative membrane protein